jgi:hypothetical protein
LVQELNQIVRETEQFRAAEAEGKLTRLPTGDGMVLVFTDNPGSAGGVCVTVAAYARALRRSKSMARRRSRVTSGRASRSAPESAPLGGQCHHRQGERYRAVSA